MRPSSFALSPSLAASWFHSLSDPTRLAIVDLLLPGELCVCELTDLLDAAQSRLSFHLKTLKDSGIVTDRREGRWVYYSLNHATLADIESFVGSLQALPRHVSAPFKSSKSAKCCD